MQMWFTNIFSMQFVVNSTKFTCHGCHSFLFYYIFYEPPTSFPCVFIVECIFWSLFQPFTQFYPQFSQIDYVLWYLCIFVCYTVIKRTFCTFLFPQRRVTLHHKVKSRILMLIHTLHHLLDVIHRWAVSKVNKHKVLTLGSSTVRRSFRKNVKSWKKNLSL